MADNMPDVQVVYERDETFDEQIGPHGYEKVGLRIEDLVVWFACNYWPYASQEQVDEYYRWKRIAEIIAGVVNARNDAMEQVPEAMERE